jgi:hypothetical protein
VASSVSCLLYEILGLLFSILLSIFRTPRRKDLRWSSSEEKLMRLRSRNGPDWNRQIVGSTKEFRKLEVQWKPLNVITVHVIVQLMWSDCPRFIKSQITNSWVFCLSRQLLIVIIRLMLTLSLCPKVITITGFHCISIHFFGNVWTFI